MPRMIDPAKLAAAIDSHKLWSGMSTGKRIQWEAAMDKATVEVPDIVYCKDCRYCELVNIRDETVMKCHFFDPDNEVYVAEDSYCSDGKRGEYVSGCGEDYCSI